MADNSGQAAAAAIREVLRDYVEGMVFADEARLRRAFHPNCKVIGHYQGELEWLGLDDFVAAVLAGGSAAPDSQTFWEIQALDVSGDSAAVKVLDDYLDMRFTDYLSLLHTASGWVIVNKLYYLHP